MNLARLKFGGAYLVVISSLQACLYLALSITSEKYLWLFYFDPRLGIFFLETLLGSSHQVTPGILRWLAVGWIFMLGVFMLTGRPLVKAYIISEIVLVFPSLVFSVMIAAANMSSAHGFSVGELFFPVLVMLFFSLVPLSLAFWLQLSLSSNELVKILERENQ